MSERVSLFIVGNTNCKTHPCKGSGRQLHPALVRSVDLEVVSVGAVQTQKAETTFVLVSRAAAQTRIERSEEFACKQSVLDFIFKLLRYVLL